MSGVLCTLWTAEGLPSRNGSTPSGESDCLDPQCPASRISWYDALAFANRLSEKLGLTKCYVLSGCSGSLDAGMQCDDAGGAGASLYDCNGIRIPTEAEWEYAARAGTRTAFYGGNILPQSDHFACEPQPGLDAIGWYCGNSASVTHPIATKQPNAWGIYDLLGNAWEPTSDPFPSSGYGAAPRVDPGATLESGLAMSWRGGVAWGWAPLLRSASHLLAPRSVGQVGGGLRLVRRAD